MKKILIPLFLFPVLLLNSLYAQPNGFVHAEGDHLELGETGETVWLRGMGIGNYVADGITDPDILYLHHDSTLFEQLADYGMTAVRFYLRVDAFETAPCTYNEDAFEWMTTNLRWASQNGIYLNPVAMGVPGMENGNVSPFWSYSIYRQRLKAFWAEFAARFADEPAIGGYDILNEPVTTYSSEQWTLLAQEIVDTIRTADQNHLIILEPLYGVVNGFGGDYNNPNDVMFLVDDNNILYDFHFYRPLEYTHWYEYSPDIPHWPDVTTERMPRDARWMNGSMWNPSPPEGDTDWDYYEGFPFLVQDHEFLLGKLNLEVSDCSGTAWFDDVIITRHNEDGTLVDTIFYEAVSSTENWQYTWQNYGAEMTACDTTGYSDSFSLMVNNADNYGGWTSLLSHFEVEYGYAYKASGAIKAMGMNENGFAICRVDFYNNPSGSGFIKWNQDYIPDEIGRWRQFGIENNVPMNVGEFGVDRDLLDEEHGGLVWIETILEEMVDLDVSFTYHLYDLVHDHQEVFDAFSEILSQQGVKPHPNNVPNECVLHKAYPNPFNLSTGITVSLPESSTLSLKVFNSLGQEVRVLCNRKLEAGHHHFLLEAEGLSTGIYFIHAINGNGWSDIQKVVLLK